MVYLEGDDGYLYWLDDQGNLHEVEENLPDYDEDDEYFEEEDYEMPGELEEVIYEEQDFIQDEPGNPKGLIFLILAALVGTAVWYGAVEGPKLYNAFRQNSSQSANIAQVVQSTPQPTEIYHPSNQSNLTPTPTNTPYPTPINKNSTQLPPLPPGFDFYVEVSYYNPFRGGDNCFFDCETTGTDRIISNGLAVGPYWWNPNSNTGGSACPKQFNGENIRNKNITILVKNEVVKLECMDAGTLVYTRTINGIPVIRADVLHDDGERTYDAPIHHPYTKNGQQFGGFFWPGKFE
jgi:hypothetical protein